MQFLEKISIFIPYLVLIYILINKSIFNNKFNLLYIPLGCGIILVFEVILLRLVGLSGMFIFDIYAGNYKYQNVRYIGLLLILSFLFALLVGNIILFKRKVSTKVRAVLCLIFCFVICSSFVMFDYSYNANKKIEVIEISREEQTIYQDDYKDITTVWLKNNFDEKLKYNSLYLSTDQDNLKQYAINNVSIQPNDIYDISFESKELDITKNKSFVLYVSSDLYDGQIIATLNVPSLSENQSYVLNDGKWEYLQIDKKEFVYVEKPSVSLGGGFYDGEFDVSIAVPEGTKVFYTTDSSDPTTNSVLYDGGKIHIYDRSSEENIYRSIKNTVNDYLRNYEIDSTSVDKCFVLRAVAVDENGNYSDIVTNSYFVGKDKYGEGEVISLVSDPDGLFSDENGICVTGTQYDEWYKKLIEEKPDVKEIDPVKALMANYQQNWERVANFEVFNDKHPLLNQNAGIKVNGASRRAKALKDFSVYARKKYTGTKYFDADILDNGLNVHSVVLRQGDANLISQYLVQDRDVAAQKGKRVTVFLNGEYWYETYMLEKYSDDYFTVHYGLDNDNVEIIKLGYWDYASKQEQQAFLDFMGYVESLDLSSDSDYEKLLQVMDVQSYIDYQCIRIYMADMDYTEEKNNFMWRTVEKENNAEGDGRYRWALYDLDLLTYASIANSEGLVEKNSQIDSFKVKGTFCDYPVNEQKLYKWLKNNKQYRKLFVNTMMDLINTNYSADNVSVLLSEIGFDISWNDYFFVDRADYLTVHMEEEFGLTGTRETIKIVCNTNEKCIKLNSVQVGNDFEGEYYTDYSIDLYAEEAVGLTFDHWELNGQYYDNNSKISLDVQKGGMVINAVYI